VWGAEAEGEAEGLPWVACLLIAPLPPPLSTPLLRPTASPASNTLTPPPPPPPPPPDVYTSRVSNFLTYTPYYYFRSPSQSLAHDRGLTAYYEKVLRHGQGLGSSDEDEPQAAAYSRRAGKGAGVPAAAAAAAVGRVPDDSDWDKGFLTEDQISDGEVQGGGGSGDAEQSGSGGNSPAAR